MVATPKGILITRKEFDALDEYSCSIPTGQRIGKRWKHRVPYEIRPGVPNVWYLGEYVETCCGSGKHDYIGIEWTRLILPEGLDS